MKKKKILTILKYKNSGNIGSLFNCIKSIKENYNYNLDIKISNKVKTIENSDILILPGVGHFDEVMRELKKDKLCKTIINHSKKKVLIGICIGMQIMFENSEEGKLKGLGLFHGEVKKIKSKKLPIIGWNKTLITKRIKFIDVIDKKTEDLYLYYIHSYEVFPKNEKSVIMKCVNSSQLTNAMFKINNTIGMQFHPELSSTHGINILNNIIKDSLGYK